MLFAIAALFSLFAWYGWGTWLLNLMKRAGYDLGSTLIFTWSLTLSTVAVSVITVWACDRFGPLPTSALAAGVVGASSFLFVLRRPGRHDI